MAIQASYEGVLSEAIDTATGAKTFVVSPYLTNADGVLKVGIGQDNEEWFEVTGVHTGNSTITTTKRGLSLTTTGTLTEVAGNRKQHYAGEKIAIVVFPNTVHSQNTDSGTTSTTFTIDSTGSSPVLSSSGLTGDRTITFQDRTGQLADIQYVTDQMAAVGAGNVVGPASSTANAIVLFNSTTGKIIQNQSSWIINGTALTLNTTLSSGYALLLDHTSLSYNGTLIYCNTSGSGILSDRTVTNYSFASSRINTKTSGTLADDFDTYSIDRVTTQNGAGGTFTCTGSVLRLRNVCTQSAGVLTDTSSVLELSNNNAISTHFYKIRTITNGTNTINEWLSDGTTPNAALTGTAGDICLNGDTGKPYYCTGTNNWTAFV